ncbi:hypothetical protein CEXT_164491 [Caerostris extrusa]|uniref:Uncharacterized protein n=1 Tax=Caerostris extrusa TaxID=172846 RepID=A0AAV4P4G8_CAEEX|nr:hypothetical protein CEXT_164491 [Caerostris extrusa]
MNDWILVGQSLAFILLQSGSMLGLGFVLLSMALEIKTGTKRKANNCFGPIIIVLSSRIVIQGCGKNIRSGLENTLQAFLKIPNRPLLATFYALQSWIHNVYPLLPEPMVERKNERVEKKKLFVAGIKSSSYSSERARP